MSERLQTIRRLLIEEGLSVAEVAEHLSMSKTRVYGYTSRYNLPCNNPVAPAGARERRIVEMSAAGFSVESIGQAYRLAPVVVQRILTQVRERYSTDESSVAHPG
jgi:hypothetical protein